MKLQNHRITCLELLFFFAFTLLSGLALAEPLLEVTVDRQQITLEERLTVQVEVSTSADQPGRPQINGPKLDDWQVVGKFESTSYDSRNRENRTQFQLQLQPVRVGQLQVGSFVLKLDGQELKSDPITVTVTGQGSSAPGNPDQGDSAGEPSEGEDPIAFLEWEVTPREAYIGQELKVKLYAYVTTRLMLEQIEPGSFDFSGFWTVDAINRGRNRSSTVQRGQGLYTRTELAAYHLFPIRASTPEKEVALPALPAALQLREASFFSRGRPIKIDRTAAPVAIDVKPLPTNGRPSNFAGPAVGRLKLEAGIDRRKTSIEDGIQLTVTTQIDGLINNVPELTLPDIPGFRVFPPSSDVKSGVEGQSVRGKRRQTWLLKAQKPGKLTIPELTLPYFNPLTGAYAVAKTQKFQIEVTGEAKDAAPDPQEKPTVADAAQLSLHGVRVNADLSQNDPRAYRSPLFLATLLGAPMLLLFVIAGQKWHAKRTATQSSRQAKGAAAYAHRALQKLNCSDPDAHSQIARIINDYLEKRFEQSFNGLTHQKLRLALEAHRIAPKTIDALQNELDHCDFARFAPQSAGSSAADEARDRADRLIAQIEEEAR